MKFIRATLRTALQALRRNILRSVLTTLGIVIGVAAVIAMTEIGQGSSQAVQQTILSMGANNLLVLPGAASSSGASWGSGTAMTLTPHDAEAILREAPSVVDAAPIVRIHSPQVVYGNRNWSPPFAYGTTPGYLDIRDWQDLDDGQSFTDQDVRNTSKVCLIGQTVVRELFPSESPVGKEVRISNVTFKVIGVLSRKGANMMGVDQDDIVLAPWTTVKYRVGGITQANANQIASAKAADPSQTGQATVNSLSQTYPGTQASLYPAPSATEAADTPQPVRFTNVDQILTRAASAEETPAAIREIEAVLRDTHHLRTGQINDFQVRDLTEMSNALGQTAGLMTKLLLAVALISLVVGGVGIMNIMLVSVMERTREIGLRMAVGARARDILRQFLVEAVVLCLMGGILGVVFGLGSSYLVSVLLHWPTEPSLPAVLASVTVSATVGIVFGYYPAWKASRLDPIEALRYE